MIIISVKEWYEEEIRGDLGNGNSVMLKDLSIRQLTGKYDQDRIRVGLSTIFKGGPGSGNYGHAGREGQVGGSDAAGGESSLRERKEGEVLPDHIVGLRIPPAWTNVRYNPDPAAALWVKGYDSKDRMQSIYSPEFTRQQADAKWARITELDKKIGEIRKQNVKALEDIKTKESAACLQLIMAVGIRPGSERDTKAKVKAYGATTLEGRHVKKQGDSVVLEFVGKKGVQLSIFVDDRNLGNALFKRAEIVGKNNELFKVSSDQLLTYVDSLDGGKFTTKDFRTYLGTKLAVGEVKKYGDKKPRSIKEYKKFVKEVATMVSRKLGNTPTVALQSYINPTVFARWQGEF